MATKNVIIDIAGDEVEEVDDRAVHGNDGTSSQHRDCSRYRGRARLIGQAQCQDQDNQRNIKDFNDSYLVLILINSKPFHRPAAQLIFIRTVPQFVLLG